MIILLLEAENNLINPVVNKLTQNVNKSCVKMLNNKIKADELYEFRKPPLFELGWFLVYAGTDKSVIRELASVEKNVVILQAYSRSKGETITNILTENKYSFKIIDNLKVEKSQKIAYIKRELCISDSDATYLYNRTRGYLRDLTNGVCALKGIPIVSRADIKALVPKTSKYGLNDLYNFLLGLPSCELNYAEAVSIIYKYRYGIEFLREFLLNKLEIQMTIAELVASGELSVDNYREFKHKRLTDITEFQLYKLIEQNKEVSYDYLYFLFINISKITVNSTGLLMFLNMFRLRKERNDV